jgi:hypothetical protein
MRTFTLYIEKIKSIFDLNIYFFTNTNEAMNCINNLRFESTKVIISGALYAEFINMFKVNMRDMYVAPKIIVFIINKEKFLQS